MDQRGFWYAYWLLLFLTACFGNGRRRHLVKIYEFGTAPRAAKEGYALKGLVQSTEQALRSEHAGQDLIFVYGASIHGQPGVFEFARFEPESKEALPASDAGMPNRRDTKVAMPKPDPMGRAQAMAKFKDLVGKYGLQWTGTVPKEAYEQMAACNTVLNATDRREALGLR